MSFGGVVEHGGSDEGLRSVPRALRVYARIVECSPDLIAVVDRRYVYQMVNPTFTRMYGVAADRIVGGTVAHLLGEEVFQKVVRPRVDRCFAGEVVQYEAWFTYPLGVRRCMEVHYYPLYGDGEVEYVVAVVHDITERKQSEEERERLLRELEQLAEVAQRRAAELQCILDNMVDGVYVCDAEGRITLANEAGVRMMGLASLEEVQRPLVEFSELLRIRHPDGRRVAPEELPLARALAGQTVVLQDMVATNPQTQQGVYARANAVPIKDEKGRIVGAVAVFRDVTELAELDQLKDAFISVAAHELKTPVAVMKGYAQALLRLADGVPPQRRRMLEAINRGSDRIDRVVNDLLDISRLQLGRLELVVERIDLPMLVEQVVDRVALTAIHHRLRLVSAERVVVWGDRDRLEQVLFNLIDNALRYSPDGGEIDLEIVPLEHEVVVSVRDQGVGIPRAKQGRIFQRFYRAHTGTPHDYGGMGVGLYISREIVSRHAGRMWFESEEGRGSGFHFSLPLRGEHGGGQLEDGSRGR